MSLTDISMVLARDLSEPIFIQKEKKIKPRILEGRENLRPYEYPIYDRIHIACIQSPWSHLEVSMASDLVDWESLTEISRKIIAGILRGFTLIEIGVGCYWRIIAEKFPHPEISTLAATFSHQETIHTKSYDHLEATIGIDTYEAFLQDHVSRKKLGDILNKLETERDLATSLAIFSGAVEGVSLFSSFAILLSFTKKGQFKGMQQILSWSVVDEATHSSTGIKLYHDLISEAPELKPDPSAIYEGFDMVVQNEMAFIETVFSNHEVETISREEAEDFVRYRANLKLMELKLPPIYELNGSYKPVKHFFDTLRGKTMNDFFALARNGSGYTAKISQDFGACEINL